MSGKEPIERAETLDKPGIVGARWWNRGLIAAQKRARFGRRLLIAGMVSAAVIGVGACIAQVMAPDEDDPGYAEGRRSALELQRTYGWSFGAAGESVTFDGVIKSPFDRASLSGLAAAVTPRRTDLAPYALQPLVESATAKPKATPSDDATPVKPLSEVIVPMSTSAMDAAFACGKGLAALLTFSGNTAVGSSVPPPSGSSSVRPPSSPPPSGSAAQPQPPAPHAPPFDGKKFSFAVVVDLPGPEAVAFAAGAATVCDPVMLFDNWPHPRGVVKSHLTLAALVYYQPLFERLRKERDAAALPLFVLDHTRLATYTDESTQFDNRYVAKLPAAAACAKLGVKAVLYVVKAGSDLPELDDLNDDFLAFSAAGIAVRAVATNAFGIESKEESLPPEERVARYGSHAATHGWFWKAYPVLAPAELPADVAAAVDPKLASSADAYRPAERKTAFSSGVAGGRGTRPVPADFATAAVFLTAAGAIAGYRFSRSGSWARAGGAVGG